MLYGYTRHNNGIVSGASSKLSGEVRITLKDVSLNNLLKRLVVVQLCSFTLRGQDAFSNLCLVLRKVL